MVLPYFSGPNDITVFTDDGDLADLPAKLVARYSAKVSTWVALYLIYVMESEDQTCMLAAFRSLI